ncbi:MAG: hypothetical protein ACI9S8_001953 [Chlamydiales bacterium]|jgi:hypothetical protein
MNRNTFFLSAMNLLFIAFFFITGATLLLADFYPQIQGFAADFVKQHDLGLKSVGALIVAFSTALFAFFCRLHRRNYFNFRMGNNLISVSEEAISETLIPYWKKLFPDENINFQVKIPNNVIEIWVDFPAIPSGEEKNLLQRVEEDLERLLGNLLDYRKEFNLIVRFAEAKIEATTKSPPPIPQDAK